MENSEELLRQVIKASNRTTRAVRAFVRFLFIQLSAITLAVLVFQLGSLTQDPSDCSFGICPPSPLWSTLAGLIWVAGVVWSSFEGWKELELSDPDALETEGPNGSLEPKKSSGQTSKWTAAKCGYCGSQLAVLEKVCWSCGKDRTVNYDE